MTLSEMIELVRLLIKYGAIVEENEEKQNNVFVVARGAIDRMRDVWGEGQANKNPGDIPF